MDSGAVIAVASGGSALVASGLATWRADARAAKAANAARACELAAALALFLSTADQLQLLLARLPNDETLSNRAVAALLKRLPSLEFVFGEFANATLGRRGRRALAEFIVASNRLHMIAPRDLLDPLGRLHAFLTDLDRRHEDDWQKQWLAIRSDFLVAGRAAAGAETPPSGERR